MAKTAPKLHYDTLLNDSNVKEKYMGSIKSKYNEQNENRIFRADILKEPLVISIIAIIQKKNR